jgi:beta-xylosidase
LKAAFLRCRHVATLAFSIAGPAQLLAQSATNQHQTYVTSTPAPDRFVLAASGHAAPIAVSTDDYPGVIRAVNSLRADIKSVTGDEPRLATTSLPYPATMVIVGTLGKSPLVDSLVRERRLDARGIAGKWETFLLQVVEKPRPGVARALVIAGSDKRGTIYGIYDLSAQIGVSPWYWWADVPIQHRANLFIVPGRHSMGEPAVKYRGIFLNDEAPALAGWARATFGGFNHQFYEKLFELLLRMKANYLWPAMWGNAFNDDDKLNPQLADEYGIVMGTSHHEPMLRAQQEWRRYGSGEWNYEHNDSTLRQFWEQGIRNMGSHESIVTIGMRGDGDMPMTAGSNIALLEKIVADQRKIIERTTGKDPASVPQLWALYKEVQDYYDRGMRVPDDVTLLFADDNWGNIRRLPEIGARPRNGGYGVYYHFDYVGGPRNYKWINTNQISRVWEQMHLAYEHGVDRIWIVNVGDLKPMEFPIQFFLEYAWNARDFAVEDLHDYPRRWAEQQFGAAYAADIADFLTRYTTYNSRRKPELLAPDTYSLVNYREAETVVADYNRLLRDAERVSAKLSPEYKDAYYELVLHPIQASANLNEMYVTAARNRLYARQGRAATNELADSVRSLFDKDAAITRHYNTELAGGKWVHMMDQTHVGYTYWQEPPRNVMPQVDVIQVPAEAEMGVAVEGSDRWWPTGRDGPVLPDFDSYAQQTYYVEVFNRGQASFDFTVTPSQPWLHVSPSQGRVDKQQRVLVSVDWNRAPPGSTRAPITIKGANDRTVTVEAPIHNVPAATRRASRGFIESNGYVSIEAEHYARAVNTPAITWKRVPALGRTLSAVTAFPVTAPSQTPGGGSPRLEYSIDLADSGEVTVRAYLSPTLNFRSGSGLRYAVSLDDATPEVVNMHQDSSNKAWEQWVSNNIVTTTSRHRVARPGPHVLKFWMVDAGVVLQKLVVERGTIKPSYLGPPESFRTLRSPSVATSSATALSFTAPSPSLATAARFDWFTYEGKDPIYKQVKAGANEYLNPILAGFYPDPSMIRVGDDYYLVTSSFAYFPGVPLFHSRDLVHWKQIGHILTRPSQLNVDSAEIGRGIFAPTLRWHKGTFYMITTLVDRGGNFIVTSRNAAGPWSDPIWLPEVDGIDPSIFFDDDGKAWIVNNGPPVEKPLYQGHRAIWIQEFDVASSKMVGPRSVIVDGGVDITKKPIWIEAPHILKVNGSYYLICAEGGTAEEHSEVVFKSSSVLGPWKPYAGNPILTQRHLPANRPFPITSAGHADFVQTPKGEWWAVFLGVRPYAGNDYNNGRETYLLPVHWTDGWPVILTGTETVPYVHRRPDLPADRATVPMSGNFVRRDDFSARELGPEWSLMRTPRESWYDLTSAPGWLTIHPRPADIGGREQPSFVGRRQQHAFSSASTSMRYMPIKTGDKAGLVAFQNETHYYFLGVAKVGDSVVVEVEQHDGRTSPEAAGIIARAPIRVSGSAPIYLKIEARGAQYDFYYGNRENNWTLLKGGADGRVLSSKVAGGFIGTYYGMYAYTDTR